MCCLCMVRLFRGVNVTCTPNEACCFIFNDGFIPRVLTVDILAQSGCGDVCCRGPDACSEFSAGVGTISARSIRCDGDFACTSVQTLNVTHGYPWNFRMHWRRCLCPQQHGIRRARKLPELHWKTGMCRCRHPSESRHLPTNLLQWRRCLHWAECYSGARQQLLVHQNHWCCSSAGLPGSWGRGRLCLGPGSCPKKARCVWFPKIGVGPPNHPF